MVGFDLESTGTNPAQDRIVTATVVYTIPGTRPRSVNWLIDPDIDVPDEAAEVHGWTTTRLRDQLAGCQAAKIVNGIQRDLPRTAALAEIRDHLAAVIAKQVPLVAMNAAYDLTMLEAELRRHDQRNLAAVVGGGINGIVDPAVLDKAYDAFRRVKGGCKGGKHKCGGCGAENKTLTGLAAHYGVVLAAAHSSDADALCAVRLAARFARLWPDIARLKLSTLHDRQVAWRAEQCNSLRAYFDRIGQEHDGVCPEWPVHRQCTVTKAVA